ncbi:hypothetical protein ACFSC4_20015 [Deinococcus malanensis]|uniref:hypothetical protein n=1 Tax=Deinococcus malanensis TaxID=1706855 RepID=UPI00362C906E
MPSRPVPAPSRAEHFRQLKKVFSPLSPRFVADELGCTLEQATVMLYGSAARMYCWVRLSDLASLSGVAQAEVELGAASSPAVLDHRTAQAPDHPPDSRVGWPAVPAGVAILWGGLDVSGALSGADR